MALTTGTRLGPYEVLAPLGAGGMGEVYRARDTRLSRTVAIKVLPADAAADASARARFEREARAIATLSHPHICVVHDVGHQNGVDYLVMELLEGETLAQRIARAGGPLPLPEVLSIGAAIADALDRAHRAGIVHRDLKPLNVMLTKSGPKLLDFGLAKRHAGVGWSQAGESTATTAVGVPPGVPGSPARPAAPSTLAHERLTGEGTIVGSLHYMSPEQVEGHEADPRSDIWALGAVLYEMATGQRPFEGESPASVVGAILKDTPAPVSSRLPLSPPLFDRIVQRCLAKAPDDRCQSAKDLRDDLQWVADHEAQRAPRPDTRLKYSSARTALAIAGLAVMVAAALAASLMRDARAPEVTASPETRLDVVTPTTDDSLSLALSPDGRQIVYAASGEGRSRLWLRALSSTTAQPLPGTEGGAFPFWSPDGRSIAFFADSSLKRLDLGGNVRTLAPIAGLGGGTWSPAGVIVIGLSQGGTSLVKVPAEGGDPTPVTTVGGRQSSHRWPSFLADGNRFLYWVQGTPEVRGIYLGALDGRDPVRLFQADSSPHYLSSGWILFARGQELVAQCFDETRGVVSGDPVVVADGVAVDGRFSRAAVSVSETGLIAYRTGSASRRQLQWFDRSGRPLATVGEADTAGLETPRLSADGRQLAVGRLPQSNQDVWLLEPSRQRRLTFDPGIDRFPVWSPDGLRVAFMSNRSGVIDLYTKAASGAGSDDVLVVSDQPKIPTSWSADGRFLLFHSIDQKTSADLWVMPFGERSPRLLLKTPYREAWGAFSPDGRWVAYQSNESGRPEIYVRAFSQASSDGHASTGSQWQVSSDGGLFPVWRRDGKELFFLDMSSSMMAAPIDGSGAAIVSGAPTRLFQTQIVGAAIGNQVDRQFDVSPDGRFLINVELSVAASPITLIQNWSPRAQR